MKCMTHMSNCDCMGSEMSGGVAMSCRIGHLGSDNRLDPVSALDAPYRAQPRPGPDSAFFTLVLHAYPFSPAKN